MRGKSVVKQKDIFRKTATTKIAKCLLDIFFNIPKMASTSLRF